LLLVTIPFANYKAQINRRRYVLPQPKRLYG